MIITQTNRLQLRHINQSDAAFIFNLYNQAPFIMHIGDRGLSSLAKTRDFIKVIQANYKKYGFWLYLVEDKLTKEPVGINGLVQRDYLDAPESIELSTLTQLTEVLVTRICTGIIPSGD